jgi:hypothetical protein
VVCGKDVLEKGQFPVKLISIELARDLSLELVDCGCEDLTFRMLEKLPPVTRFSLAIFSGLPHP